MPACLKCLWSRTFPMPRVCVAAWGSGAEEAWDHSPRSLGAGAALASGHPQGGPSAQWGAGPRSGSILTHSGHMLASLVAREHWSVSSGPAFHTHATDGSACPSVEVPTHPTPSISPFAGCFLLGSVFLNVQTLWVFSGLYQCQCPVGVPEDSLTIGFTCRSISDIPKIQDSHLSFCCYLLSSFVESVWVFIL